MKTNTKPVAASDSALDNAMPGDDQATGQSAEEKRATRKDAFLRALFGGATVTEAARMTQLSRRTAYFWRQGDTHFARLWDAAENQPDDPVEAEAIRRALMGVRKPVYRGGTLVGEVTEKSDTLLMFLLKSRQPAKYGGAREGRPDAAEAEDDKLKGARDALFSKLCALTGPGQAG